MLRLKFVKCVAGLRRLRKMCIFIYILLRLNFCKMRSQIAQNETMISPCEGLNLTFSMFRVLLLLLLLEIMMTSGHLLHNQLINLRYKIFRIKQHSDSDSTINPPPSFLTFFEHYQSTELSVCHRLIFSQGCNVRKVNCGCVYSAYILKPVLSGRNL